MTPRKSLERCIFTWNIENFSLCLAETSYQFRSPIYTLPRSRSSWYMEVNISRAKNIMLSILLRRNVDNDTTEEIKVRFVIHLRTPERSFSFDGKNHVFTFMKESCCGDEFEINFPGSNILSAYDIGNDILIVACEMILLFDEFINLAPNMDTHRESPSDLIKLTDGTQGNAVLVTEGKKILVHKEILSAVSPVFSRMFETGSIEFQTPFCEEVILSLLRYLYSGEVTDLPPIGLYECANHYSVSVLQSLLAPQNIFTRSCIETFEYSYCCNISNFLLLYRSLGYYQSDMTECEMIRIQFSYDHDFVHGNLIFLIELWNLKNVLCLSMEMSIIDNFQNKEFAKTALIHPERDGYARCYISIPQETFFGEKFVPLNELFINFIFRFRYAYSGIFSYLLYDTCNKNAESSFAAFRESPLHANYQSKHPSRHHLQKPMLPDTPINPNGNHGDIGLAWPDFNLYNNADKPIYNEDAGFATPDSSTQGHVDKPILHVCPALNNLDSSAQDHATKPIEKKYTGLTGPDSTIQDHAYKPMQYETGRMKEDSVSAEPDSSVYDYAYKTIHHYNSDLSCVRDHTDTVMHQEDSNITRRDADVLDSSYLITNLNKICKNKINPQISLQILNQILFCVYSRKRYIKNVMLNIALYEVAVDLNAIELQVECIDLINKFHLTSSNVSNICLFADKWNLYELKSKCISFIRGNLDIILDNQSWTFLRTMNADLASEILQKNRRERY